MTSSKKIVEINAKNELKFLAGITLKKAVKPLFSLWLLKKRKLGFIEKVKKKRF